MMDQPCVLKPFVAPEAIDMALAAVIAKRSVGTVRNWCLKYNIGRRIANGQWQVSRIALQCLLDGNDDALAAYLKGDRAGPLVTPYLERFNLPSRLFITDTLHNEEHQ